MVLVLNIWLLNSCKGSSALRTSREKNVTLDLREGSGVDHFTGIGKQHPRVASTVTICDSVYCTNLSQDW